MTTGAVRWSAWLGDVECWGVRHQEMIMVWSVLLVSVMTLAVALFDSAAVGRFGSTIQARVLRQQPQAPIQTIETASEPSDAPIPSLLP